MDPLVLVLLFVAGCLTGFLAGLFGVGGGIILVPILLFVFTAMLDVSGLVATHLALGTSLLVVIFASISAAYRHHRNGQVIPKAVLSIGIASIVAAYGGAMLAATLSGETLQKIFAVILMVSALRLLLDTGGSRRDLEVNLSPFGLSLIGVVAGLASSLGGVGGGIFTIPMLYSLMGFPLKKAVGTSSATIVLTAFAATAGYVVSGLGDPDLERYRFTVGYVDFLHAIPVIVGTLPFARLGADAAQRLRTESLRKTFAVFLLVVAARMLI